MMRMTPTRHKSPCRWQWNCDCANRILLFLKKQEKEGSLDKLEWRTKLVSVLIYLGIKSLSYSSIVFNHRYHSCWKRSCGYCLPTSVIYSSRQWIWCELIVRLFCMFNPFLQSFRKYWLQKLLGYWWRNSSWYWPSDSFVSKEHCDFVLKKEEYYWSPSGETTNSVPHIQDVYKECRQAPLSSSLEYRPDVSGNGIILTSFSPYRPW